MTTYNLSANTNLSSLGSGGPVTGDIVNIVGWTLTIDTSSTWTFSQLNFTSALSRVALGPGVTATLNVTISSSAALTASPITLATGQSLTINGVFNSWGTTGNVISIVTISGGVFVLNAGSATTQIYQGTTGGNPNLLTQTGGTITVTGAITLSYTSGSQGQFTSSAGSISYTGNITITGNATTLTATQQVIQLTGSSTFTMTGNFTTSGTIYSGVGPILCGGGSVVCTINGDVAIDGAGASGNLGVNVSTSGAQCTINGKLLASSGAAAATVSAGTLFWGGTRTITSNQMSLINCLGTGTLNIDSLILNNSGTIAIIRTQTGTIISNGTTGINNLTSSAGAAVIGAGSTITITNTPSNVGYMPTSGQVQNGVSFGYTTGMLIGSAASIDPNALATSLETALGTGSLFTSIAQATVLATDLVTIASDISASTSTLAADVAAVTATLAADITAAVTALAADIVTEAGQSTTIVVQAIIPAAVLKAANSPNNFGLISGDTLVRTLTLGTITGWTEIIFTAKNSVTDPDSASILQLTLTGATTVLRYLNGATSVLTGCSLSVVSTSLGTVTLTLPPGVTDLLLASQLAYSVRVVIGAITVSPIVNAVITVVRSTNA